MKDTELVRSLVDSLDTGLPERPDLAPVRSAGARQRRRNLLGRTTGVCAAAAALAVPAVLLAGAGGTSGSVAPDVAADRGRAVAPASSPVSPDELAGPEFGVDMRAAVEQAVPGATFESEELGDGWQFREEPVGAYWWTVGDPVHWETFIGWRQSFRLAGGGLLQVSATRTSSNPYVGDAGPARCDAAVFPSRVSCHTTDLGAQTVMVNDGIQYADKGRWARQVDVFYFDQTRGMDAHVELYAFTDAPTWAGARTELPSADELTALGLQPALKLPAPDHYPLPDDIGEHTTSTP
jgi:hypothetical protein